MTCAGQSTLFCEIIIFEATGKAKFFPRAKPSQATLNSEVQALAETQLNDQEETSPSSKPATPGDTGDQVR